MAKTKKELGLDSMGVQKSMRLTDYLGDGLGQLPLNIMSCLVGQLTYFYTEKVGLAAGMVATMLLIAKIFDAFSDLAMGKIMDNGKSPKGKCRPWFARMAIPAFVSIVLLFTVPKNMGSGLQAAYVLITNVLITAIVYTAVAIPYSALMAIRTESSEERGKMGIFRAAFGYIAGMVIAILLIPITNMLGGTQSAWIKVAVVFSLISLLSLLILYKTSKENVQIAEKSEDENVPFVEGIKILFKNKYWVIMLALQFLMNISYSLSASGGTYYAKYTAKDKKGNTTTKSRKITVEHNQEDTNNKFNSFYNKYLAGKSVSGIISEVRSRIKYNSSWGGDDPVWYGLTNYTGNCYVHAMIVKKALDKQGIKNQLIYVTDKSHYWNLVYQNGKWRHYDATPTDHIPGPATDKEKAASSAMRGRKWSSSFPKAE